MDRVSLDDRPTWRGGSPMRSALCSASTVSSPARPGATIFGPPLNPAKKCGSTKPVVMRTSASTQRRFSQHRHVAVRGAKRDQGAAVVAGVVVDDPDAVHESSPSIARSSAVVFPRWVPVATRTMTSSGRTMPSSSSRTAGIIEVARLGAGAVAHRDGDGLPGADQVAQRRARHWVAQRSSQRRGRIGDPRLEGRLHHGGPDAGRQLDRKPAVAVGQTYPHRAHPVRPPARPRFCQHVRSNRPP